MQSPRGSVRHFQIIDYKIYFESDAKSHEFWKPGTSEQVFCNKFVDTTKEMLELLWRLEGTITVTI